MNVPGTDASFTAPNTPLYIVKNSFSGVSAWIPYAIERASDPVRLMRHGYQTNKHRKKAKHAQINMFLKGFWILVQVNEEV